MHPVRLKSKVWAHMREISTGDQHAVTCPVVVPDAQERAQRVPDLQVVGRFPHSWSMPTSCQQQGDDPKRLRMSMIIVKPLEENEHILDAVLTKMAEMGLYDR